MVARPRRRRPDRSHLLRGRRASVLSPKPSGPSSAASSVRDPADGARLLHAVVDRAPPLLGLVVVGAARVEADVAADGSHVAQRGRGDRRDGRGQARVALTHQPLRRDPGRGSWSRRARSPSPFEIRRSPGYRHQTDHGRCALVPTLHVRPEIGAAGDQAAVGPSPASDRTDLPSLEVRLAEGERWQTKHGTLLLLGGELRLPCWRAPRRRRLIELRRSSACPAAERILEDVESSVALSPPSAGVGTRRVSPKSISGKLPPGPKRGSSPPCRRASSALRIMWG